MITIRRANPADEGEILVLARALATSSGVDEAHFAMTYRKVLSSDAMCLAVAQAGDEIVGYVLGTAHPAFYANGNVAWVEEIMVSPDFRRKGIGRLLMDDFEAWAGLRNCRLVALATRRASDFYQALGYAESAAYFRKTIKG